MNAVEKDLKDTAICIYENGTIDLDCYDEDKELVFGIEGKISNITRKYVEIEFKWPYYMDYLTYYILNSSVNMCSPNSVYFQSFAAKEQGSPIYIIKLEIPDESIEFFTTEIIADFLLNCFNLILKKFNNLKEIINKE